MNKKLLLIGVIPLVLILAFILTCRFRIRTEDNLRRNNRLKVQQLVRTGQSLPEAERLVVSAGFELVHSKPITPSVGKDYLQQLVIVGDTQPNTFETIGYTTGISWMPFTHEESSYVVIEAELDGTIREIR